MTDEFNDIITGLEQRISLYKAKLSDYQKKRKKIDEEINTVTKYLELAETLYRVEVAKRRTNPVADGSAGGGGDDDAERGKRESSDVILLEKTRFAGLSVPEGTFLLLKEAAAPIHAKDIYNQLTAGGIRIRSKTPVTSIAISLSRDKRFKKVAPNTFSLAETSSEGCSVDDPRSEGENLLPERR